MAEQGKRGCSLIYTEARAHAAARACGIWVSVWSQGCAARARAHSWGRASRSRARCGRVRSPDAVGQCLTGLDDRSTDPSSYVMNSDTIYIYTHTKRLKSAYV
jgi:hypothetical protein